MNKKEKLALLLGMLSGDGCLPIGHNSQGYRDYAIKFCNTNDRLVGLFDSLFFDIFSIKGKRRYSDRFRKKRLFEFSKYSKDIYFQIKDLGFPEGVKRDILRVLPTIKKGKKFEKLYFIFGVLITDGSLRKKGDILFHSGSKLFLQDLSILISEFTGKYKNIRAYLQKSRYYSYQLYLNKKETEKLICYFKTPGFRDTYSTLRLD